MKRAPYLLGVGWSGADKLRAVTWKSFMLIEKQEAIGLYFSGAAYLRSSLQSQALKQLLAINSHSCCYRCGYRCGNRCCYCWEVKHRDYRIYLHIASAFFQWIVAPKMNQPATPAGLWGSQTISYSPPRAFYLLLFIFLNNLLFFYYS